MNERSQFICEHRLTKLGYKIRNLERRTGPFSATIYLIDALTISGQQVRMIYKQSPSELTTEYHLLTKLGQSLERWGPKLIASFEDEPRAFLIPYYETAPLRSRPDLYPIDQLRRHQILEEIAQPLRELHQQCSNLIHPWESSGVITSYRYLRDWADDFLDSYHHQPIISQLSPIADAFYAQYGASSMRCPSTLTHGDLHWGNILMNENRFIFIDWEWAQAATPMRDVAILLQEEPDDDFIDYFAYQYAQNLKESDYNAQVNDLMHDFYQMMVDNTFMMASWECNLYRLGETSLDELELRVERQNKLIHKYWNKIV